MGRQEKITLIERTAENNTQQVGSKYEDLKQKLASASGYLFAFGNAFFIAASLGCAQSLGGYVPGFQLNMWRYVAQVILSVPGLLYNKVSLRVDRSDILGMLLLTTGTIVANLGLYQSSLYLPVGTVVCLNGALRMLILSTASAVRHRECLPPHLVMAIITILVGVVCVTQPDFVFDTGGYILHPVCPPRQTNGSWNVSLASNHTDLPGKAPHINPNLGYLFILMSVLGLSTSDLTMNMKMRDVNTSLILAWTGAGGVVFNLIPASIFEDLMFPSYTVCQLLLCSHGISVALATACNACSLSRISPELFVLIYNFQLVFVVVSQYTLLKEVNPGHQNLLEILGALSVFLGNCIDPSYRLYKNLKEAKANE